MYKYFITLFAAIFSFTACEKEIIKPQEEEDNNRNVQNNCEWTFDLTVGQNTSVGSISVTNDNNYIYVTYTTVGQWSIYETHLYVGHPNNVPMNGGGSPQIALFPYSNTHNGVSSFTYTIPIDPNLICYIVAAQALVGLSGGHAVPVQYEPAWINQCLFNEHDDSGAMYGKYCLVDCEDDGFGNIETKPAIVSTKF